MCRTRLHKKPCSNTLSGSRLLGMFKNVNLNSPKEVLHSVWVAELHAIMQRICYSKLWLVNYEVYNLNGYSPSGDDNHIVADVPQRQTSPAAKSEEKRTFSQAMVMILSWWLYNPLLCWGASTIQGHPTTVSSQMTGKHFFRLSRVLLDL